MPSSSFPLTSYNKGSRKGLMRTVYIHGLSHARGLAPQPVRQPQHPLGSLGAVGLLAKSEIGNLRASVLRQLNGSLGTCWLPQNIKRRPGVAGL